MRMSLHKLYINTLMYMYTYFRCKNPFINLGMKRCNGHCSVGPASLPIGQVHGGSLFVTDAGGVWAWGVEMWKVWKSIDLSDSRLKRLDASHDSQYTYIYMIQYTYSCDGQGRGSSMEWSLSILGHVKIMRTLTFLHCLWSSLVQEKGKNKSSHQRLLCAFHHLKKTHSDGHSFCGDFAATQEQHQEHHLQSRVKVNY